MSDNANVKPVDQMTKAELLEYVATLEAQRVAAEEERRRMQAEAQQANAGGAGYLVTVANPLYNGVTLGVKFERGQAFIPLTRQFPHLKPAEVTEEYYVKYNIGEAEKRAMKERAALPTATVCANLMRDDYGYEVRLFMPEQLAEVKQLQAVREAQWLEALKEAKQAENAKNILTPSYA